MSRRSKSKKSKKSVDRVRSLIGRRALGIPRFDLIADSNPSEFSSQLEYSRFLGRAISALGYPNPTESAALTFEPFHGLSESEVDTVLQRLAPEPLSLGDLRRLGVLPLSVELLNSYLPLGSHWHRLCFEQVRGAQFILCDPYYCSALFQKGKQWHQPPLAMDWLLERENKRPKEPTADYWENPSSILSEGAQLAASRLHELFSGDELEAALDGQIPEMIVRTPEQLGDVAGAIRSLTRYGPDIRTWFRGQNREYLMPDASDVSANGLFLHRAFRDPSLIPRAYRQIDVAYSTPERMKTFVLEWMHWYDLANRVLGPDRRVVVPKKGEIIPADQLGPGFSSTWETTDDEGNVVETFTRHFVNDDAAWQKSLSFGVYGGPSQSVDVTASVDIAWWFATHQYHEQGAAKQFRPFDWANLPSESWPCIYVFMLSDEIHPIIDASVLPWNGSALRAYRQQSGFLGNGGMLLRNGPARFISLRLRLHPELGTNRSLDKKFLFPSVQEDGLLEELMESRERLAHFPLLDIG
jgi:hypothetical protein